MGTKKKTAMEIQAEERARAACALLSRAKGVLAAFHPLTEGGCSEQETQGAMMLIEGVIDRAQETLTMNWTKWAIERARYPRDGRKSSSLHNAGT